MKIEAGKHYRIVNAPVIATDMVGKVVKPVQDTKTGALTRGKLNPEAVMFPTMNGGGLFFEPADVEELLEA